MTAMATIEAVRKSVLVQVSIERAFEVFTEGFDSWWPRDHQVASVPLQKVVLEGREGGRWYEIGTDGSECVWGCVLAYEPPARIVFSWHLNGRFELDPALTPERASEVEVRFTSEGAGATRVELEHRNLERHGETAEQLREGVASEGGWPGLMDLYAEAAAA
jgi:uncharacterized protein YndB with AHSA1/START domain